MGGSSSPTHLRVMWIPLITTPAHTFRPLHAPPYPPRAFYAPMHTPDTCIDRRYRAYPLSSESILGPTSWLMQRISVARLGVGPQTRMGKLPALVELMGAGHRARNRPAKREFENRDLAGLRDPSGFSFQRKKHQVKD